MNRLAIIISVMLISVTGSPQSLVLDSLQQVLTKQATDTGKILVQAAMAKAWWYLNPDTAIVIGERLAAEARSIGFYKGQAICYNNIGVGYDVKGNYPKALDYHFKALRIRDSLGDVAGRADSENNIGEIYKFQGEYDKALDYYFRSVASSKACSDPRGPGITYVALSDLYLLKKDYTTCLYYAKLAEPALAASSEPSLFWTAQAWNNAGHASLALQNTAAALQYHQKALEAALTLHEKYIEAAALNGIGSIQLRNGQTGMALGNIQRALNLYIEVNAKLEIKDTYLLLSEAYERQGDFVKALSFYKLSAAAQDSLFNDERNKLINVIQYSYEIEKKQREIELLAKDNALNREKRKQQFAWTLFLGGMLACAGAIVFLLYRNGKIKERNNVLLLTQKEEIARQAAALELANKTKDKLFAIIGHDLRGPVGSLGMLLDMLRRQEISREEFNAISHNVKQQVDTVYITLENLLIWSRAQMKGIQTERQRLDAQEVVAAQLTLLQQQANTKNINLANNVAAGSFVLADREQLAFIIRNLVANAIKFTSSGGHVRVQAGVTEKQLTLAVKDNGSGIAAEMLPHIFTLDGFRSEYSSDNESGTGLGLIICREFAESNGGNIRAESTVGIGTVFYVTLVTA